MTNKDLANIIFPNLEHDVDYYENKYPERCLDKDACVTRFAPSPTGYMHLGGFYQALIDYNIAKNSNGVFFLRNEDTDQKREVENAVKLIMKTLNHYDINPDEYEFEGNIVGNYGPYIQSKRKEIYHTYIKKLIEMGRAYPCFCTKEELDEMRNLQESRKKRTGYYGIYAKCRKLSIEEQIKKINSGEPFVIRFKSNGDFDNKIVVDDEVKGKLFLSENDIDDVIMKSGDMLPTYHFAHIVDDHLMHTTHVVRGEEWLPSVTKHIEMFDTFGFKRPKYVHTPLIIKKEGQTVRKISKRKDPEASMSYYEEKGYPTLAVIEALMTIINSNYEEWHALNPDKSFIDFKVSPKKMSSSGALFDLEKLNNISRDIISKMSKEELLEKSMDWSSKYDRELFDLINSDKKYYMSVINIEREQKKPRKDYTTYKDIKNCIWYMYDKLFYSEQNNYEWQKITDKEEIKKVLNTYFEKYYSEKDDKDTWFSKMKDACDSLGYCSNMKEYKLNSDDYKGSIADFSMIIRVAMTTKSTTPDLYEVLKILGKDRINKRVNAI
ncbi:MAG: glutamate--tRNA ligase [bacterium]|nr:glutamate--tRNA ligase [bacterium]